MTRSACAAALGLAALLAHGQSKDARARVLLRKERMAAQFDTVNVVKNVVKANPLLFLRGEIPLYYERALTYRLSMEVGVGVTLRNYMAMTFMGDDADDFGAGTEIIPNLSYRIAARFYLEDDLEPQGWYVQPEFGHLVYAKDIREVGPNGVFTEVRYRDQRTFNDVRALLGYQMLSSSSNWLIDVYGGVAFRDRNLRKVQENLDPATRLYTYKVVESNDIIPAFFLGVKVGVGF